MKRDFFYNRNINSWDIEHENMFSRHTCEEINKRQGEIEKLRQFNSSYEQISLDENHEQIG